MFSSSCCIKSYLGFCPLLKTFWGKIKEKRYHSKPLVFVWMILLGKRLVIRNGNEGNFTLGVKSEGGREQWVITLFFFLKALYFESWQLRAHIWFYELAGKHERDKTKALCNFCLFCLNLFHLKLIFATIKNTQSLELMRHCRFHCPTLRKVMCSRVIFVMFFTFS